jgi:outer membrane lipopolysaccharide assembly protein LptE/RlpB
LKNKTILTPNLWLTAFTIETTGCSFGFEQNGNMTMFALPRTEKVLKSINDFNTGAMVTANRYAEICKRLRHELFLAKIENEKGDVYGNRK